MASSESRPDNQDDTDHDMMEMTASSQSRRRAFIRFEHIPVLRSENRVTRLRRSPLPVREAQGRLSQVLQKTTLPVLHRHLPHAMETIAEL